MVRQHCCRKVVYWTNGRRYADAVSHACTYADDNPNADADPHTDTCSNSDAYADAHTNTCSNGDANTYAGCDTDSDSHINSDSDSDSNSNSDSDSHPHSHS